MAIVVITTVSHSGRGSAQSQAGVPARGNTSQSSKGALHVLPTDREVKAVFEMTNGEIRCDNLSRRVLQYLTTPQGIIAQPAHIAAERDGSLRAA